MTPRLTRIAGLGHYVPPRVVTNHDLEQVMDTSDAWIQERTGIKERHFAAPGVTCTNLAAHAARAALADAGWTTDDVQLLIFATLSPDLYFPGNGVLLQHEMGLGEVGALDIRTQCTGFVYGLSAADGYIRMGMVDRILLIGAELQSPGIRTTTEGRDTGVLFGDGAGAMCLEVTDGADGSHVMGHRLHSNGKYALELCIQKPGAACLPWISKEMIDEGTVYPYMNGREVFKHAITKFPDVIREVLSAYKVTPQDLTMVIPHQANQRITEAVRKRLDLPDEKVYSNIDRFGNTTAASIPIAFSEVAKDGKVKRGDLICLASFGSGFTWGASLLRF
jgi:3-oxoacyl-[acyl-carrier-protein] synthase-3